MDDNATQLPKTAIRALGFTLLEMAVTLGLLALMSLIIIEGIRLDSRASTQIVEVDDEDWGVFLAHQSLKGVIETTNPYSTQRVESLPLSARVAPRTIENANALQLDRPSCVRPH